MLLLVGKDIPLEVIAQWTSKVKNQVENWAAKVYLKASDNIVSIPKYPDVLLKRDEALDDLEQCPDCGSEEVDEVYTNCLCCRTYEGNGRTCWTAPYCNNCKKRGYGDSDGGRWEAPDNY